MSQPVKVLISGDVDGKFASLFKRVATINASNAGPFDVLFCCGRFFGPATSPDAVDAPIPDELLPFLNGEQQVPIPTYFIGAWGQGCRQSVARIISQQDRPGPCIHYLGRSGIKKVQGLQVAFLDGRFQPTTYVTQTAGGASPDPTQCPFFADSDVASLRAAVGDLAGDLDLLLTNEWPRGILIGLGEGDKPKKTEPGCQPVTDMLKICRPRYLASGCSTEFYARPPYANPDLGLGSHVTRFVALAATGNDNKAKSLHALQLVPAVLMTPDQLGERPSDTTPYPYASAGRDPNVNPSAAQAKRDRMEGDADKGLGDQGDWRWQAGPNKKQRQEAAQALPSRGNPEVVRDVRKTVHVGNLPRQCEEKELIDFLAVVGPVADVRRNLDKDGKIQPWAFVQFDTIDGARRAVAELSGQPLMGRPVSVSMAEMRSLQGPAQPVEACWFCLSNASVATWLIASVASEVYLSLDKSPVDPMAHVLIVPVEHFPSTLRMSDTAFVEVRRYVESLRSYLASQGKELLVFERYMQFKKAGGGGGNHCHLNCIGIPKAAAARAADAFQTAARQKRFEFKELPGMGLTCGGAARVGGPDPRTALRDHVGDMEYMVVEVPGGQTLVRVIKKDEKAPIHLLRDVSAELAGRPDRADWRKCTCQDQAEEEAMAERFKAKFAPYDFVLMDAEGAGGEGPGEAAA